MGLWDLLGLLNMGFESWLENEIYYLFWELINFVNKIILENLELIFSHEKYSEISKNLEKIPRDTLEHDEPK